MSDKIKRRMAGLNKKKIFPQEDLEIAIKDLDVITDPTEYREQEKYIKHLQNPKENLDKIKVIIDGKETNLNALDFLKFALDVKTGKRKPLGILKNND